LKTYRISEAVDFVLYVLEQRHEDSLWDMYIHTDMTKSFSSFKKAQKAQSVRARMKAKAVSIEEEKARLAWAGQFIKIKPKGGGDNGGDG
jgi:hypothetical protein